MVFCYSSPNTDHSLPTINIHFKTITWTSTTVFHYYACITIPEITFLLILYKLDRHSLSAWVWGFLNWLYNRLMILKRNILFFTLTYSVKMFYIAKVQILFKKLLNYVSPEAVIHPCKKNKCKVNYFMQLWEHIIESVNLLKFMFFYKAEYHFS